MKTFDTPSIRNVALCSHGGAGKTSWVEAAAFDTGLIERMGNVIAGTTISDFDPDEAKRQISINLSVVPVVHQNTKINLLDTPGFFDFVGETLEGIRAAESALIFVDVSGGVQVGTEKVWQYCEDRKLPRIIVINKMDREHANFDNALAQIEETLTKNYLVLTFPIGEGPQFKGVVDVIKGKSYTFADGGKKVVEGDIPADLKSKQEAYYNKLVEVVSESDDELLEAYLEGKIPTPEQVVKALHESVKNGKVYPVMSASSLSNIGTQNILDAIIDYFPSPDHAQPEPAKDAKTEQEIKVKTDPSQPFSALVFKTTADPFVGRITYLKVITGSLTPDTKLENINKDEEERISVVSVPIGKKQDIVSELKAGDIGVLTKLSKTLTGETLADPVKPIIIKGIDFPKPVLRMSLKAKSKADDDKIGVAVPRLLEEDSTLEYTRNEETREIILGGLGEAHLQAAAEKLSRKFGVATTLSIPKIPYRETIKKTVKVQGRHKKQTGGHGQFGDCWVEVKPLPRGSGFVFEESVFGGSIPKNFIPAIEKGFRESIQVGTLAGYPVIDISVNVYDGSYHPVDSSEMAFKLAANLAYRKAFEDGGAVLLEPIYMLTITVPDQYMGDIMGDISSRRGKIIGSEAHGKIQVIKATAPLIEVQRYAIDLGSITGGRGSFSMEFDHYEEAPPRVVEEVVAKAKAEQAEQ